LSVTTIFDNSDGQKMISALLIAIVKHISNGQC
jgi:hypothetical protein